MPASPSIVITSGEPAGIGPELLAMLARQHADRPFAARLVAIGDRDLLAQRARRIGVDTPYVNYDARAADAPRDRIGIWHLPLVAPAVPGQPDPVNARSVFDMLARGCDACATGAFEALVTAPVQKSVLLDAGFAFVGHTEFFAERTHTPRVVMMLVGGNAAAPLRVALVTTHLALREVPQHISRTTVTETLRIVQADLVARFGLARPRVAVCGLNPHAGEGGHFGREEIDAIEPAIAELRGEGFALDGPLPADTVFVPDIAGGYDAIVAMYHDQGLPVLKAVSFGHGVNVTLGLPFVRTSVDHGTALDLACDPGRAAGADPGSLVAALELAIALASARARNAAPA